MKDISIIIPTFNEKGNLQELFTRIDNSLDCAYECILVDDNSADGTGEFAEELSRKYPIITIHRQSKKSLASAVVEGFRHASGNVFVVMDADLQHSPEKIPEVKPKENPKSTEKKDKKKGKLKLSKDKDKAKKKEQSTETK